MQRTMKRKGTKPMRNTRTSKNGTAEPVDALIADVAAIKRDLTNLISQRVDAVSGRTRELVDETAERARAVHERIGETAHARPLTTILVAALAGAVGVKLVGWMFRR
jgi:hypothetical protein